ncbi:hypothetical protein BVI2075_1460004 [Burkholderia vietnamiensis]|nr:hypothetical protein BVI2075_1460004 [Burkholderia vietnamiensis]
MRPPAQPHISRHDLLQSFPFSEERCDGPPVSARLGKLHQAAVRRNSRRLRFLNGAHVTNF